MSAKYLACYGDSLVQGFPFGVKYSWTTVVEQLTQLKLLNYGLCGDCCDDIYYRMRQYALPEHVRHVLFLGGANDIIQGVAREYTLETMARVLAWCGEKQYQLCLALPLISTETALNRQLLQLRQDMELRFQGKALLLDLQPAIGLDAGARSRAYVDGIHPKASTYEAMGKLAAPLLEQWLQGE